MSKKHWHFLVAFVAGGFLFAPVVNAARRLVGR